MLTDTFCRNLRISKGSRKRYFDGDGLYLELSKTGKKYWRVKYRIAGKEKLLSIGSYPDISLKEARQATSKARELLIQGEDPSISKKKQKYENNEKYNNTFETIALEWHSKQAFTAKHSREVLSRLKANIFPDIGNIPIQDITSQYYWRY